MIKYLSYEDLYPIINEIKKHINMSEKYTVVHKKSRVLVEGSPKLPSASTIEYGEIAINYADGHETLSIKNSSDKIATFSSDSTVNASLSEIRDDIADIQSAMTEDELVIATSLNDLNDRIDNLNIPESTSDLTNDSGFITGYTETDPTVPAWAKAASKPAYTASEVGAMATSERSNYSTTAHTHSQYATTAHTHTAAEVGAMATSERSNYSTTAHTHTAEEVGAMATSERSNYLTTATTIPNVDNYFDSVEYDSNSKRINFKHGATVKGYVDASSFIKDGMVSSVTVSNGNLVVTFNTEAGREDITLALTEIFNPNNYYTKTDADGKFLTGYTETDPTVPAWAKAASKPSYTAAEVGAMATSERSNYSTTAHTHTAAEVGAMATSERGNYLTTATTIPTEASIEGSGFTKNAITAITINGSNVNVSNGNADLNGVLKTNSSVIQDGMPVTSLGGPVNFSNLNIINGNNWEWLKRASNLDSNGSPVSPTSLQDDLDAKASTAHTHTAAEVGAMATSERSNYSTTAHTHSQYATTAHTHDYLPLSGGDVTGDVYLIENNNEWIHTQLTEFSIKFVSGNTGNRNVSLYPYWKEGQVIGTGDKLFLPNKSGTLATTDDIPTESDLTSSGFTKNGITGINVNGTAATITNGVAEINVQGGGGSTLPSVTAADNGKVLMVVNGAWAVVMPTTVYTGTDTPLSSIGNDGDIYLQTS